MTLFDIGIRLASLSHQEVSERERDQQNPQPYKLQCFDVFIVDLNDVPAYCNHSHNHDHFDSNLMLMEIYLQRFDKLESQHNDENTTECALHHQVKIVR